MDRIDLERGNLRITKRCVDCGAEINTFHMASSKGPKLQELPLDELTDLMRSTQRNLAEFTKGLKSKFQQLVDESGYENFEELADDLDTRLKGEVNAHELPFYQLEMLAKSGNLKDQKKLALAFRQGLVCNRCKSIVYSLDQLTLDHIEPESAGGKKLLPNLQLFCPECNENKADSDPTEHDISPFRFRGEPSVHWITCVEVENRRP